MTSDDALAQTSAVDASLRNHGFKEFTFEAVKAMERELGIALAGTSGVYTSRGVNGWIR